MHVRDFIVPCSVLTALTKAVSFAKEKIYAHNAEQGTPFPFVERLNTAATCKHKLSLLGIIDRESLRSTVYAHTHPSNAPVMVSEEHCTPRPDVVTMYLLSWDRG